VFHCLVQEEMTTEEVRIDHLVHSRLIGARGHAINKVMDDYKVDIRMPGRDAADPNLVIISGREDDVLDCREHLLNLEEEYVRYPCFLILLPCFNTKGLKPSSWYILCIMGTLSLSLECMNIDISGMVHIDQGVY